MNRNPGLSNTMIRPKEKAEELVPLWQEQEELQENSGWLFGAVKRGKATEAPAADDCRIIRRLDEEM